MPQDLYIVHNAFSLLLSLSLISVRSNHFGTVVIAHKKAKSIAESIQKDLKLYNVKIVPFQNTAPPLKIISSKYSCVFVSNPWHKRIIPFYITLKRAGTLHLIDDGFATINEDYKAAIQKDLSFFASTALRIANKNISFDTHFTIFKNPSPSYLETHKYNKRIDIKPEALHNIFPPCAPEDNNNKDIVIILGSTYIPAQKIKTHLYPNNHHSLRILLKDHPNLINGIDEIGCPPEIFILKNLHSIKTLHHCKSSTAYFSNYLFPEIKTEEYFNA